MNDVSRSGYTILVWLTRAHHSFTGYKKKKMCREITGKAQRTHLEEEPPGCFTSILINEFLVLIVVTDVRTRNYKYLQGLLHTVYLPSSPLVNSTLRGSSAVHTQSRYIIVSIKEGCIIEHSSH